MENSANSENTTIPQQERGMMNPPESNIVALLALQYMPLIVLRWVQRLNFLLPLVTSQGTSFRMSLDADKLQQSG
jgi:hypothetical protein